MTTANLSSIISMLAGIAVIVAAGVYLLRRKPAHATDPALTDLNPNDPAALGYNSLVGLIAVIQRRTMVTLVGVAIALVVSVVILVGALVVVATRPPSVKALAIDGTHQEIDLAQLADLEKSPQLRSMAAKIILPKIAKYAFSYSDSQLQSQVLNDDVNPFIVADSDAEHDLKKYLHDAVTLHPSTSANVTVDPLDPRRNQDCLQTCQLGWTVTTFDNSNQAIAVVHYLATFTLDWDQANPTTGNWIGLYVRKITIDNQATIK